MKKAFIIFPHQLFKNIGPLKECDEVLVVEEFLFFKQYQFHKQKLVMHRASMKYYANHLVENGIKVTYIDAGQAEADIRNLDLKKDEYKAVSCYDPVDDWLEKRLRKRMEETGISLTTLDSPMFLNSKHDLEEYFGKKKSYFQADFYTMQRKKWKILVDDNGSPVGGKWSFDTENRKKLPKGHQLPSIDFPKKNEWYEEAINYVESNFPDHPGKISSTFIIPTTHKEAEQWLDNFLVQRFEDFGPYEDAIAREENLLYHSMLSPLMNNGLLTPQQVLKATMDYHQKKNLPLNSLEGFIRQIIGWREFIRGVYVYKGVEERTRNFWNFTRDLPKGFYDASMGIDPLDKTLDKVLDTGYCHHIERLMILGNYCVLSGYHPDQVYQWFMEMFIDAYDWVMVPNVYGMSQFADGGLMATKPYISGSNYILKMSDYGKGDWSDKWDALFWNFIDVHRTFFLSNPRLSMMVHTFDKFSEEKKKVLRERI